MTEHANNFKELSKGERVLRRAGGNHTSEQPIRDGYSLAGWHISEPSIRSVQAQIERVKDLNNQNKVYVFSDLSDYLEEKLTMSWEVDKEENMLQKIHNESQYHYMACERGILSDFAPEVANTGRALQATYG